MKSLIFIVGIIISCHSCSQNNESEVEDNSIIGTWKLVEVYSSDGGSNPKWNKIENGYVYIFKSDNSFTSNRFSECETGSFTFSQTQLILTYNCPDFSTGIEYPAGTFIENYSKNNGEIILKPTYLTCIEGCGYKFRKNYV